MELEFSVRLREATSHLPERNLGMKQHFSVCRKVTLHSSTDQVRKDDVARGFRGSVS